MQTSVDPVIIPEPLSTKTKLVTSGYDNLLTMRVITSSLTTDTPSLTVVNYSLV